MYSYLSNLHLRIKIEFRTAFVMSDFSKFSSSWIKCFNFEKENNTTFNILNIDIHLLSMTVSLHRIM